MFVPGSEPFYFQPSRRPHETASIHSSPGSPAYAPGWPARINQNWMCTPLSVRVTRPWETTWPATWICPPRTCSLSRADARALLAANGNPPNGHELGLVLPGKTAHEKWFAIIEYEDSGYVPDRRSRRNWMPAPSCRASKTGPRKPTKSENRTERPSWSTSSDGRRCPSTSLCTPSRGMGRQRHRGAMLISSTTIPAFWAAKGVLAMNLVCDPKAIWTTTRRAWVRCWTTPIM